MLQIKEFIFFLSLPSVTKSRAFILKVTRDDTHRTWGSVRHAHMPIIKGVNILRITPHPFLNPPNTHWVIHYTEQTKNTHNSLIKIKSKTLSEKTQRLYIPQFHLYDTVRKTKLERHQING